MEYPLSYDPCEIKWKHPAPYAKCFFLDEAFIDLKFRTLVIRGFPLLPRSTVHIPGALNKQDRNLKKLIGIVPAQTEARSEYDEYYIGIGEPRLCGNGTCSGGLPSVAETPDATMWGGAPFHAAHFITLVFWTKSPVDEWVPPCLHFHPPSKSKTGKHSDGSDSDSHSESDEESDGSGSDSNSESHKHSDDSGSDSSSEFDTFDCSPLSCRFSEWMMRDLAMGLSRHCGPGEKPMGITIVNAAAFMPPDYWRSETYSERLQSGQATHADAEHYFMKAVKWEQIRENRPLEIRFLTMKDWIATGEWEDALSEKEMRPWLNASQ